MKKLLLITIISVLTAIFAVPQNASAKEKKIVFMGHRYEGAVDENKVPAGNGGMNVNGLLIFGVFDNHSVTDAKVQASDLYASTTFLGNVTYDESNNITLKAGGVISTEFYYSKGNKDNRSYLDDRDPGIITDTLKEDRIVNYDNFERKNITLYYALNKDSGVISKIDKLNPPTFMVPYTIEKTMIDSYKGEVKGTTMNVFVNYANHEGEDVKLSEYKDSLGRTWNLRRTGGQDDIEVIYPDGSKFRCSEREGYKTHCVWECYLSEGKIATFENFGKNTILDMGKIRIWGELEKSYYVDWYIPEEMIVSFLDAKNNRQMRPFLEGIIAISSHSIDLTKSTNAEIEKLISQEVEPYVRFTKVYVKDNTGEKIGEWVDNKYETYYQIAARKEKEEAKEKAERYELIASFKKEYGFDPSINNVTYIVKPGRNILHVIDERNAWVYNYGESRLYTISCQLVQDRGASKCYKLWWSGHFCGYCWVRNNIITSVQWRR